METTVLFMAVLPDFLIRGGFAVFCGGMLGLERERRGKPAGFRTNILICLGSCLYMMVGELIQAGQKGVSLDPTRIAAQVVSGIGFLGAGTILHSRGAVTGLTSAATIWVVAAIGLLIGAGFPGLGLLASFLSLVTLAFLTRLEPRLLGKCRFVTITIGFDDAFGVTRADLSMILAEQASELASHTFHSVEKGGELELRYCEGHPSHRKFLAEVLAVPGIRRVTGGWDQAVSSSGAADSRPAR